MTESADRHEFRACRHRAMLAAAAFMAGVGTAGAHVTMILDPLDAAAGRPVTELDRVEVAVLGSDHVDVRQIARRTLRLGTRDTTGAKPRQIQRRDVNGDGVLDLLLTFDVAEAGLRAAEDHAAVLTGGFRDGRTIFRAQDSWAQAATPISFCYVASGESETGMRCEFTQSQAPLDLPALIAEINEVFAAFGGTVTASSSVIVEAYGGHGHDGRKVSPCTNIGIGGGRGYGSTLYTVADLEAFAAAGLYLYVAEDGPDDEDGGSASVAIGRPITSVGNITNPSGEQVLAIAGGGGGGGKSSIVGGLNASCKGGWDGGAGGVAEPELLRDASAAGQDGATGNKGQGGNQDGTGSGGPATGGSREGKAGTDGIGGYGNDGHARWAGVPSIAWDHGQGGIGGRTDNAGAGGGGFGGGGGGRAGDHKGGGGGGGSWARQHSVIAPVFHTELALGPNHDPGWPAIVVTFEVETDAAPADE